MTTAATHKPARLYEAPLAPTLTGLAGLALSRVVNLAVLG